MYLPKSKYTVLVAKAGEFSLDGKEYLGPVVVTYKSEYYAGTSPSTVTGKLAKNDDDAKKYIKTSTTIRRVPTEGEYKSGQMMRYFQQNVTTGKIVELLYEDYMQESSKASSKDIFAKVVWILTGALKSTLVDGVVHPGVIDKNTKTIEILERTMPGIRTSGILYNPVEFYKEKIS